MFLLLLGTGVGLDEVALLGSERTLTGVHDPAQVVGDFHVRRTATRTETGILGLQEVLVSIARILPWLARFVETLKLLVLGFRLTEHKVGYRVLVQVQI
eukprot:CAMPEP_0116994050 /NCGR_PEP_ID=MMETSP0467-20121206/67872_1 /TAXON_ID=283647 /ORGANISM="Mesodinium pulex, Strain SPMC105" /LENGTH=98 /DNA_ID=CAMNT_0004691989 /DNA_START=269 /DNA_END=565 /DNA_ORIENTATION=+